MWDWLIWAALIAGFCTIVASNVLLFIRIMQAWRQFNRFRRHIAKELFQLAERADAALARAEKVSDSRELDASLESLRVAVARARVLREAMDEVDATVNRVTAYVPGL
jgi:hypothetical protein